MSEIKASIVLDSVNAVTGDRLTTFAIRAPKWLLAEINTHRALSRNAASSRAIPAKKVRSQVWRDPAIPIHLGANCKGMAAVAELPPVRAFLARQAWLLARYPAIFFHWILEILGLHKQVCNRILEPWMWADVLLSGTEWHNFWALRCHSDAQPEFQAVARMMRELRSSSVPRPLHPGQWHLPFISADDRLQFPSSLQEISTARCARISYQLPEGGFSSLHRDIDLCQRLKGPPLHASPFEHVAIALPTRERSGNFVGFGQWRKSFKNEANGDYA